MFLGALAQSIPDIDFLSAFWNDTASNLLAHRGFTHSILFAGIATLFLGLLAEHYHRQHRIGYKKWLLFFGLQISVHLFLDLFNTYGTGLLEPFSHKRFSFNAMFVADPFFSIWPALGFFVLLILKRGNSKRSFWWKFAIFPSVIYLFYCSFNKLNIDREIRNSFAEQNIKAENYLTTPTPLNNWLWYIVAKEKAGFFIGYRSVFDRNKNVHYTYFPQNDHLLDTLKNHEEVQHLMRFSQGFYTVENWGDTLVFNDLRFGQMVGWHDPKEQFVFHYFLQHAEEANKLVVQRGRFAKWNAETTRSLVNKITGKK